MCYDRKASHLLEPPAPSCEQTTMKTQVNFIRPKAEVSCHTGSLLCSDSVTALKRLTFFYCSCCLTYINSSLSCPDTMWHYMSTFLNEWQTSSSSYKLPVDWCVVVLMSVVHTDNTVFPDTSVCSPSPQSLLLNELETCDTHITSVNFKYFKCWGMITEIQKSLIFGLLCNVHYFFIFYYTRLVTYVSSDGIQFTDEGR